MDHIIITDTIDNRLIRTLHALENQCYLQCNRYKTKNADKVNLEARQIQTTKLTSTSNILA
jgi:hypothetical protein